MTGRLIALAVMVGLALGLVLPGAGARAAETVGVVVIHGKDAKPPFRGIVGLEGALSQAGFLVEAPEMPWSASRNYDADYEQAMVEIDGAVARLKARGAKAVVIAGHSLGGNAAVGYGARRPGLKGIIALAPGHSPEVTAMRELCADSVARAKALVAQGRGGQSDSFTDRNLGQTFQRPMVARLYLSYFDPDGPVIMPRNAAKLTAPLLWVVGDSDPLSRFGPDYAFARAPANPKNKYASVPADHMGTPSAAAELVVAWLKGL